MFHKIKDLRKAWEQGIINLYPAASKNKPAIFSIYGKENSLTNIGLSYEIEGANDEKWLSERPENKQFFSHAYFWDKSPFDSFEDLKKTANKQIGNVEGWCILIGRGSNKNHLLKDNGELRLACIDIDGYKPPDDETNEIRKRSCDEIYKAINEHAEFDFFAEKSQGGGYHLWYLTKQQVLTKQISHLNNLIFPKESEFDGLVLNDKKNNPNRNKEFIEVFSKGGVKFVSCSPTSKYEFVDDKPVELLKMKPVENINTELKNALKKAGFKYKLDSNNVATTDKKSSKQTDSYENKDYDFNKLQENILNCYHEGNMNSFGYILMDNFRRANYSKEEVFEIFKNLPIEQDLNKVQSDLDQQYSVKYNKIAGLTGLQKAIEDYCITEKYHSTYEYFTNFFKQEIMKNKSEPQWEELSTDEMILKENKLFILYDGEYWINKASKKSSDGCDEVLFNIDQYNIDARAFLVVMQDKLGYHYGWAKNDGEFNFEITPNFYQSFLDKKNGNRNSSIGQSANYFGVRACKKAISLFLEDLRKKFKDEKNYNAKAKLNYNADIYNYMKYIEKSNGISNDDLNRIHLMNNQYILNDITNKKMKIIEEKSIQKERFDNTGITIEPEIYGEIDKEVIGDFAITTLTLLKDVLNEKNIKEVEIISKEGLKKIKFDETKKLINSIDGTIGIQCRTDMVKKGILAVINFMMENKVNHEKRFYSSADGIFTHNNELYWFEDNKVKDVEKPTKEELKSAIDVLKRLFKYTSIKDKSKIATIFKWFLSAPFAYLIRDKQINGKYIKFVNLIGESDTGKSSLCLIYNNIWRANNNHKGTDAHNATNFAELFKLSGFPLFIDEADEILDDTKKLHIIKSIYDTNYSRSKKEMINSTWEQKRQIALSIAILTSNNYYESTEKSEVKRVLNIDFDSEDVSLDNGKAFKSIFNVDADEGYKNSDFKIFEIFGRTFFHKVKEKYKEETFEVILNTFLENLDIEEVLLEYDNSKALNKNIDDIYRQVILDIIVDEFNKIDRFNGATIITDEIEGLDTEKLNEKFGSGNRLGKFIAVILDKRIPYLTISSDYKHIRVSGGINSKLKKEGYKFDSMNIKAIYNLFKEYNEGIDPKGKNMRYVNIPIRLLGI